MEAPDPGIPVDHHSGEYARFTAYGHQLIAVHHRLLDRLDDLRDGIVPDRDFGAHCLALCSAVTRHHTGEDTTVFPELAARHPELRAFLDELERDHQVIAGILARVTALAEQLAPASSAGPASSGPPVSSAGPASSAGPVSLVGPASSGPPVSSAGPASSAGPVSLVGPASSGPPDSSAGPASSAPPAFSAGPAFSAAPVPAGGLRDAVRMELDGLAAVLETHFIGEEKRLAAVLDALDPSVGLTGLEESVG